jgi:hypothetical protein
MAVRSSDDSVDPGSAGPAGVVRRPDRNEDLAYAEQGGRGISATGQPLGLLSVLELARAEEAGLVPAVPEFAPFEVGAPARSELLNARRAAIWRLRQQRTMAEARPGQGVTTTATWQERRPTVCCWCGAVGVVLEADRCFGGCRG